MKRLLSIMTTILLTAAGMAQTNNGTMNTVHVDWDSIAFVAKNNPDSIRRIVKVLASEPNAALTQKEAALGFYGQSYLADNSKLFLLKRKADNFISQEQADSALSALKEALAINPLDLGALEMTSMLFFNIARKQMTSSKTYTMDDFENCLGLLANMVLLVAATGDGSAHHPFAVTSVSDEYVFMRHALKISTSEQAIKAGMTPPCDELVVSKKSSMYGDDKIYFDISRVLQIENEMLSGAMK